MYIRVCEESTEIYLYRAPQVISVQPLPYNKYLAADIRDIYIYIHIYIYIMYVRTCV
jgi:hypothetical protein